MSDREHIQEQMRKGFDFAFQEQLRLLFKNYVLDASNVPGQQDRSKLGIEKAIAAYRLALEAVDSWEG